MKHLFIYIFGLILITLSCGEGEEKNAKIEVEIPPKLRTEPVQFDTDDPAIWYNADDPAKSLILGTDKEIGGGLYVFDLDGQILRDRTVYGLSYPNNVDVEYGLQMGDTAVDIAVTVERPLGQIRAFRLPDMKPIDGGGIKVFESEPDSMLRLPMGVAMYKYPTGRIDLILSRKVGPTDGTYLWQYEILAGETAIDSLRLVRKFGTFSGGESEIEAIMVDDQLGYVYYSDEAYGVVKYHADPRRGNDRLAYIGTRDFTEDREGIALWPLSDTSGYIIVSNQQDNSFNVYPRNPAVHDHDLITKWRLSTIETDGLDILAKPLSNRFPNGILVAMSEDTTFHIYALEDLEVDDN